MDKKIKKAFISIHDNEIKDQITKKLVDAGVTIVTKNKLEDILKCDLVVTHLKEINYELDQNELINSIETENLNIIRESAKKYNDTLIISALDQIDLLENIIDGGLETTIEEREEFATIAFNVTSNYDNEVFNFFLNEGDEETDDEIELENNNSNYTNNIQLNITKDDSDLNDFLIVWKEMGERPSRISIHNTYLTKLFDQIIKDKVVKKNVFTEVTPYDNYLIIDDKMFIKINDDCYLSYVVSDRMSEDSFIDTITFFYRSGYDGVQEIIDDLNDAILDFSDDDANNSNTIILTQWGLEIEPVVSSIETDGIDEYYNSETFKSINKLIKSIKKSDKGLGIIYGQRGLGKTTMINYLSSKLDRIVIFIPNSMIDHTINNPEFRKFLKRYDKPILILDDCELFLGDNWGRSNLTTSNLLQMVDGFLSESINCNIVTIFNVDSEDFIDESLIDCNNLHDVIEFKNLTPEEATGLSKSLGFNKKYKSKSKLIDVLKKRNSNETQDIGF
jgi:putative ribosome biogenesis GTPase RsgA